ncbi:MAG: glycosyltransferase family 4 protein, partial [Treponema sp.]|nr:glycosyltransferase family 4 protein [Treponema sp.]
MKIVMFTDAYWPRVNGVTVSVDTFSRSLIKAGHEVMIICTNYPDSETGEALVPEEEAPNLPKIVRVSSMPAIISKEDRLANFSKWFWVAKQVDV